MSRNARSTRYAAATRSSASAFSVRSRAATQRVRVTSIDLLVEFKKEAQTSLFDMVRLQEELSRLFGRKVDLATPAILENPYRRRSVLKDLREIYAA